MVNDNARISNHLLGDNEISHKIELILLTLQY